ncbi:AH receptor-interacting protein isoform X2 [Planococcus citri]
MQLILGRKFKLPVWEVLVQKMSLNEVAKFVVDKLLVQEYAMVSKVFRDDVLKKPARRHHCQASLISEGLGYEDLNKLFHNPQDLEFIFEILNVEQPGEYEKENWQITDDNKLELIPKLKIDGNTFYESSEYEKALEKYQLGLTYIDQLQLREKPRDVEWNDLNQKKIPFLLNAAQCKLCLNDYYAAIEHCNSVLEIDPDNVKALFRRGKAYIKTWNLDEAKSDLKRVLELDPKQKSAVSALMTELRQAETDSKEIEKAMLKKTIF